jgi:arylsulfatase A-like enzyme
MHSPSVSPAKAFGEALGLGCSAGLLHAIAESTLLGLNGIRPSPLDLAILVAVPAGVAALVAVGVTLAALAPPLRATLGNGGLLAFRKAAWAILTGAYLLVFLKIISFWSGWGGSLLWALAASPALALACWAVFRKGQRAVIPVAASALVVAALCALQLVHADWEHEAASSVVFAARLLVPMGLCLVILAAAMMTTSRQRPFEPMTRGAGMLGALVAVWAGFWINLNSDSPVQGFLGDTAAAANPSRPNFLLIVLDTVRADHLDLFGYERETMPHLRRFAREEAQAVRTITPGSWTLPTHGSMFTGLYPSAHGGHYPFVSDKDPGYIAYSISEDVPTLAEFLGSVGYQTAGIAANFGMLHQFGLPRGFEHYTASPGPAYIAPKVLWLYRARLGDRSVGELLRSSFPAGMQGRSRVFSVREPLYRRAWEINTLARQWLGRNGGRPFFLFLNFMDAHDDYLPLPEDDERFVKRPAGEEWFGFPRERYLDSARGVGKFTAEEIEFLKGQYDAELVSLDRELGRLLDYLKGAGFFDNTLIFITTDHGEAFFEHGYPEHGNSVYQPEVDSFFLIKAPPSLGPVQPSPRMQLVDLFPTIAAVLNEPLPGPMQGAPWGAGRDYALSEMFCKSCAGESTGTVKWPDELRRDLVAVMIGDRKLIRSTSGPDEVYDLSLDPAERNPLPDPDPAFVQRAEEIIAERNKRMVEGLSKHPGDKRLLEKLRSLGYVQ